MKEHSSILKYEKIVLGFFMLIILIPALLLNIVDISGHKLIIKDDIVRVEIDSFKIEDIQNIELVDTINIKRRIKGTRTLKVLKGIYELDDEIKNASIYIYRNTSPYIKIELENGFIIYNEKSSEDTKKVYDNLQSFIRRQIYV